MLHLKKEKKKTLYLVQGKRSVLLFFHPLSGFLFKSFYLIPKLSDSENSQEHSLLMYCS